MEQKQEKIKADNMKSILNLENRKKISINGVLEVISFNDQEIFLTTQLGQLKVRGLDLKMNKLDVQNGDIIITGNINSCIYTSETNKKNNESIISKLFK